MTCLAGINCAWNICNGIGGTGVFGKAVVVKIQTSMTEFNADIFDDCAEFAGGFVDQRFLFPGTAHYLCIAAAF